MRSWSLACVAVLTFCASAFAQAPQQSVIRITSRVTDLTGTLTAEQQSSLEDKLASFEARKGLQIAVLVVATTDPDEILNYSDRIAHAWKLGRPRVDDGALLIVAKNDHALLIELGRALQPGTLTERAARRIISDTIIPLFRQRDFYGGINAGLDQMMRIIDGEPLPPPDLAWQGTAQKNISRVVPFLLVSVLFGSAVLRSMLGRGAGAMIAGAVSAALIYFAGQSIWVALLAGLLALLFALICGFSGGGLWSNIPRTGGWGGGFVRGSGARTGGEFPAGPGRFNGGGASGRW